MLLPAAVTAAVFVYSAIDAFVIEKRSDDEYAMKEYNRSSIYWLLIVIQLAYPVALTLGIREYVYEPYFIPTASMSPGFLPGDRILVNKRPFREVFPKRGDVIVFRAPSAEPGRTWIKRVIGLPGDRLRIAGPKIRVNDRTLEHEPLPSESLGLIRKHVEGDVHYESCGGRRYPVVTIADDSDNASSTDVIDVTVPDGTVYVLGDNRTRSRDSRHIGAVNISDIIGYVEYNYFPAETWARFGVCGD